MHIRQEYTLWRLVPIIYSNHLQIASHERVLHRNNCFTEYKESRNFPRIIHSVAAYLETRGAC